MTRLTLQLLGPFVASYGEQPLSYFRTRAVQALLIYLVNQPETHPRESLMALLWPDVTQGSAQNSLRQALYHLRQAIPEVNAKNADQSVPFLLSDRQTIQVNPEAGYDLDVATFARALNGAEEGWPDAVALYRGDFLCDFYLPDSAPFEEWALTRRADLRRRALVGLDRLTSAALEENELGLAERYTRQQLAIDNLNEGAHRQLMAALARAGRRSAALSQYETCRLLLAEELGVEPVETTTDLYRRILAGDLDPAVPLSTTVRRAEEPPHVPAFARDQDVADAIERPVFVARERELAQMDAYLAQAMDGHGSVCFVIGTAGRGKTALLTEFGRQAQAAYPDLLVANGNCNAYSGVGDPYLPFRELMGMLTGDLESQWAAGIISRDHAQRLWASVPNTLAALVSHGPHLVDTFVPGRALLSRAKAAAPAGAPWLETLRNLVDRKGTGAEGLEQSNLFQQLTNVLRARAEQGPLLLLLDDMQWADPSSVGLLFHLGRRLPGSRILVACAYRPEEVELGQDGERHPLEDVLVEFKRQFGDVWIDLGLVGEAEGQRFVEAFLESQPNQLGKSFRTALAAHTGGHALFTVELLRAMQERGDLVQDESDMWVETPALDWGRLPARVEAVIEARIERLDDALRDILSVASVEGATFTAQVVARVQEIGERELLRILSQELERRHRLVREGQERQIGRRLLSGYHFAHALFQHYLYHELGSGQRRLLHQEIARALETLCQGSEHEIAVQLAFHYQRGGRPEEAIHYLRQAAEQATAKHAHREAITLYRQALALLAPLQEKDAERWTPLLIQLQGSLGSELAVSGAYADGRQALQTALSHLPAKQQIDRARLVRQIGESWVTQREIDKALGALAEASDILMPRPDPADSAWWESWLDVQLARAWAIYWSTFKTKGEEMASLLEEIRPCVDEHGTISHKLKFYNMMAVMHTSRCRTYMVPDEALAYAERILASGESVELLYGSSLFTGLFTVGFIHLWREELDQAEVKLHEALQVATDVGATGSQLMALTFLTLVHRMRGETDMVLQYAQHSIDLAQMEQNQVYLSVAMSNMAWLAWQAGDMENVRANGEPALATLKKATFTSLHFPAFPLLALALAERSLETAVSLAHDIINQPKRLPDDLTEQLVQGVHFWDESDRGESREHLERAVTIAQQTGYF